MVTCNANPCTNNGTCVPTDDEIGFRCDCPQVSSQSDGGDVVLALGPYCDPVGPCDDREACRADAGVCQETRTLNGTVTGHQCLCLVGFTGARCETELFPGTTTPKGEQMEESMSVSSAQSLVLRRLLFNNNLLNVVRE